MFLNPMKIRRFKNEHNHRKDEISDVKLVFHNQLRNKVFPNYYPFSQGDKHCMYYCERNPLF